MFKEVYSAQHSPFTMIYLDISRDSKIARKLSSTVRARTDADLAVLAGDAILT